jgi:ABC-type bacteriocin/lantibiotic exporter with double-glycine peptidase domain
LIVVSHRASTVAAFSRILVLAAGRIVEDSSGTLKDFGRKNRIEEIGSRF